MRNDRMKSSYLTAALFLVASLSGSTGWVQGAFQEDVDVDEIPSITVSGRGTVKVAPNIAEISVGVITEGGTAREALSANNGSMTALQQVLKQGGVAEKDIQTVNLSIDPRYSQPRPVQPGQPQPEFVPRIVGYQVTNTVTVTVRDVKSLGSLLDAVVTGGANQVYGISFRVDQPEQFLEDALKEAVAKARRKAELLAQAAGAGVGKPLRILEQSGGGPPVPIIRGRMMAAPMAAESVPMAPGEQSLSVDVQVVFALSPAP